MPLSTRRAMRCLHLCLHGSLAVVLAGPASALAADTPTPPTTATPDAPCDCIRAGTPVVVEITEALNSGTRTKGETFAIRLAEPLVLDGITFVAAGATGRGEVVHAAASRGGGAPGELLLAARYIDDGGQRIPLRAMKLAAQGGDNSGAALGASFGIGPFALFIHGDEVEIPVGTRALAKLARDVVRPASTAPDGTAAPSGAAPIDQAPPSAVPSSQE